MNGRPNILAVDSDGPSLALLTDILASEGYDVRSVDCGELGLAFAMQCPPRLILLEMSIPNLNGFEFCRRLKDCDRTRDIPVVFTGLGTDLEEKKRGFSEGAIDFLSKPFQREEVLARVRIHLELIGVRAELDERVALQTAELQLANERLKEQLAERSLAEEALRESEERFRNLADTAPVGIWVSSPDKLPWFYNKTALTFTGRAMEQLIGLGWTRFLHPDDIDWVYAEYVSAVASRRSFRCECRMRRADGEYRWVLNVGIPRFANRVYVGHIGTVVDITVLKRNHDHVVASQKLESLGVLTAGIAHDFNNMLGAIFAECDLARMDIPSDSPLCEGIGRIKAVAVRAAEIVDLLMAYSGGKDVAKEHIDISAIVDEALQMLSPSIPQGANLHTSLAKGLPMVHANVRQMRNVVSNLVMNAAEALEGYGGLISVVTDQIEFHPSLASQRPVDLQEGNYVRLVVSDTGCGMTEDIQARAFDPFYTTKFLGRGLGLAAVQGILRSHAGTIRVHSQPNKGSRFEVLLPCDSLGLDTRVHVAVRPWSHCSS
jgi:PAS domain S-box-containing protein